MILFELFFSKVFETIHQNTLKKTLLLTIQQHRKLLRSFGPKLCSWSSCSRSICSWSMNHLEYYSKSNMLQEYVLNATAPGAYFLDMLCVFKYTPHTVAYSTQNITPDYYNSCCRSIIECIYNANVPIVNSIMLLLPKLQFGVIF